ncbi:hypothetical protein AAFN88_16095 [Pelagibius sp. CAU 1746]|uniref:hypothetical protein n=1 Tax=Pelagibius sp. CAU 1746 TaxID=3140370 RepID=UPI00325A83BC
MIIDKVIGVLAVAVLLGFFGILVGFVPDPELIAVIVVVAVMAIYEFYVMLFKTKNGGQ